MKPSKLNATSQENESIKMHLILSSSSSSSSNESSSSNGRNAQGDSNVRRSRRTSKITVEPMPDSIKTARNNQDSVASSPIVPRSRKALPPTTAKKTTQTKTTSAPVTPPPTTQQNDTILEDFESKISNLYQQYSSVNDVIGKKFAELIQIGKDLNSINAQKNTLLLNSNSNQNNPCTSASLTNGDNNTNPVVNIYFNNINDKTTEIIQTPPTLSGKDIQKIVNCKVGVNRLSNDLILPSDFKNNEKSDDPSTPNLPQRLTAMKALNLKAVLYDRNLILETQSKNQTNELNTNINDDQMDVEIESNSKDSEYSDEESRIVKNLCNYNLNIASSESSQSSTQDSQVKIKYKTNLKVNS
jgi:hypothetical protein